MGSREQFMSGELLIARSNNAWASDADHLEDDVKLEFNPNSGNVYLVDKDYNVVMLNGDDKLDISDAVFTLGHLFLGSPAQVPCEDALDANDDGNLDVSDAVYSLFSLFTDGTPPPAPYPDCGEDPTGDDVGCTTSTCGS